MKKYGILALVLAAAVALVPFFTVFLSEKQSGKSENEDDISDMEITLYRTASKKTEKVKCYDYICAVVSGEMQASSNIEALKAQSIAAFTYLINKMEYAKENPESDGVHPHAYVCDDYSHCKAYLSKNDALKKWGGEWFEKYYPNIEKAVSESLGRIITFEGKPINAVFHAISNGKTCSAAEVWGAEVEYLQSVDCPDDVKAAGYESTAVFSKDEFAKVFEDELGVSLPKDTSQWIGKITRAKSGMVASIDIAGTLYEGTHIRRLFSLRSASFDVEIADDVRFTVYGYGHGVGMSQNEADKLARNGKKCDEILKYFYRGVKIEDYKK